MLKKVEVPNEFREECLKVGLKLPKNMKGYVEKNEKGKWEGILSWRNHSLDIDPGWLVFHSYTSSTVAGRLVYYRMG
jgi:hypothetical protein